MTKEQIKNFFINDACSRCNLSEKDISQQENVPGFFRNVIEVDSLDIVEISFLLSSEMKIDISDEDVDTIANYSLKQIVDFIHGKYIIGNSSPLITPNCNNRFSGYRIEKSGSPYCKVLKEACKQPERSNHTIEPYCYVIGCPLYKYLQKSR